MNGEKQTTIGWRGYIHILMKGVAHQVTIEVGDWKDRADAETAMNEISRVIKLQEYDKDKESPRKISVQVGRLNLRVNSYEFLGYATRLEAHVCDHDFHEEALLD